MFHTLFVANTAIAVSCLFFAIFLTFLYVSKTNMNNLENKIYKLLLFWNLVHLIVYIIAMLISYQAYNYHRFENIINMIFKLQMSTMLIYFLFLTFYLLVVSNRNKEKFMKFVTMKNNSVSMITVFILSFLIAGGQLSCSLVIDYNYFNGYGTAGAYWYVIIAILIVVALTTLIINRKVIEKKKLLPFIVLFILVGASFLLLALKIFVSEKELIITLITYLMYHSIENPDMKLVNELTLAKNQAEKANNAKSDFLSSMSHELRTPLNAIVGLSQMITTNTDNPEIVNDANDILKASNNLLELVDGILDINQLDSNNMEIVNRNYNPVEVFNDLERMIRVRIGDKPIELRCRFSNDLPNTLYGDKDKVKRIINNLLTNAVKYTSEGYIDFNVDCVSVKDKCNLRISVSDTGRGIRDDQKDKLFTKFYRLEEDKDSDISGTGLGLAITKSLVELMGGEISVNSTEGIGSTFFVTISQDLVNTNSNSSVTEIL